MDKTRLRHIFLGKLDNDSCIKSNKPTALSSNLSMDISEYIKYRTEELKASLAGIARYQKLCFEKPIIFTANQIPVSGNYSIFSPVKLIDTSIVYYFKIAEDYNKTNLITAFADYRQKMKLEKDNNGRACCKLPKDAFTNTSATLYVGSVQKENRDNRLKVHLGLGAKLTYGLHLNQWAPPDLILEFHYVAINDHSVAIEIELLLAKKLQPLLGKH